MKARKTRSGRNHLEFLGNQLDEHGLRLFLRADLSLKSELDDLRLNLFGLVKLAMGEVF